MAPATGWTFRSRDSGRSCVRRAGTPRCSRPGRAGTGCGCRTMRSTRARPSAWWTRAGGRWPTGGPEEALEELRSALELWRGDALVELSDDPSAQAEAGRLEELRVNAPGGAVRGGAGARAARRRDRRAPGAHPGAPAPRATASPAHARPLPVGAPEGGARRLPRHPPRARGAARDGAGAGAPAPGASGARPGRLARGASTAAGSGATGCPAAAERPAPRQPSRAPRGGGAGRARLRGRGRVASRATTTPLRSCRSRATRSRLSTPTAARSRTWLPSGRRRRASPSARAPPGPSTRTTRRSRASTRRRCRCGPSPRAAPRRTSSPERARSGWAQAPAGGRWGRTRRGCCGSIRTPGPCAAP